MRSLIFSLETILNDSLFEISRLWQQLTLLVTRWIAQIYLLFFTNVIQWICLSNYVIPSNIQLTLDKLYQGRSKHGRALLEFSMRTAILRFVCNICLWYVPKFHLNLVTWSGSTIGKTLDQGLETNGISWNITIRCNTNNGSLSSITHRLITPRCLISSPISSPTSGLIM